MPSESRIAVAQSAVVVAAGTAQQEITAVLDESKLRRESHSLQQVSSSTTRTMLQSPVQRAYSSSVQPQKQT